MPSETGKWLSNLSIGECVRSAAGSRTTGGVRLLVRIPLVGQVTLKRAGITSAVGVRAKELLSVEMHHMVRSFGDPDFSLPRYVG